jgi:hypothetical protein
MRPQGVIGMVLTQIEIVRKRQHTAKSVSQRNFFCTIKDEQDNLLQPPLISEAVEQFPGFD